MLAMVMITLAQQPIFAASVADYMAALSGKKSPDWSECDYICLDCDACFFSEQDLVKHTSARGCHSGPTGQKELKELLLNKKAALEEKNARIAYLNSMIAYCNREIWQTFIDLANRQKNTAAAKNAKRVCR